MASRVTAKRAIVRVRDGVGRRKTDTLAGEEPMEVRVNGEAIAVTMRTPGDDFDLALGFCLTEGMVGAAEDIDAIRYCEPAPGPYRGEFNTVDLAASEAVPSSLHRHVYTASSCGVCGTASIEAVHDRVRGDVRDDPLTVTMATLTALPDRLRAAQAVFERTGGLHAAGLFDAGGELVCVREDVGRHNAVDKLIGWAAREGRVPLEGHILMVSGRVAFEIVQKALWAGVPMLTAVSAPSSLAVDLAESSGMTLVGFLRGTSMNVYSGAARITDLG